MLSINFVSALQSAFKIPELRARIVFVFAMFTVYAVGLHIPIPASTAKCCGGCLKTSSCWSF
jgi:preprotein translocase subunit SecY